MRPENHAKEKVNVSLFMNHLITRKDLSINGDAIESLSIEICNKN